MAAETITGVIQRLGFQDILLWLLSFAVIYGILSQTKILPKQSGALLAIGLSFLILLAAPANLLTFISSLSSNLVLVVIGVLLFLVLLESFGVKHTVMLPDKEGKIKPTQVSWLTQHPRVFQIGLLLIAGTIFVSAGGLSLLGLSLPTNFNISGTIFIAGMILAVLWLISESHGKD
jgi:hypothetical protein